MDDDQQFCLRWNNHQSTLISVFDTLLENGTLVDCTLAAEGKFLKAHKVVLSACSPYFATLLSQQYDKHPIFILKDVKFQELRAMMDYMYRGEVNISQDQLAALLKAAESLQIKGLSDSRSGGNNSTNMPSAHLKGDGKSSHVPAPKASGLTIENKRPPRTDFEAEVSGSREGSVSPSTRKRKKVNQRPKSLAESNSLLDNHDQHSNSSSHSNNQQQPQQQQLSNTSATSAPSNNLSVTNKKTEHDSNQQDHHEDNGDGEPVHITKRSKHDNADKTQESELMIEPKNEYDEDDEDDDGNVEDLTMDDEMMDDLDQAGPSHGGEGSSQGYHWQMDGRSQESQEAGQHRDAQGTKASYRLKLRETSKPQQTTTKYDMNDCLLESENFQITKSDNNKYLLLPVTKTQQPQAEKFVLKECELVPVIKRPQQQQSKVNVKTEKAASLSIVQKVPEQASAVVGEEKKIVKPNHPRIKYSRHKNPVFIATQPVIQPQIQVQHPVRTTQTLSDGKKIEYISVTTVKPAEPIAKPIIVPAVNNTQQYVIQAVPSTGGAAVTEYEVSAANTSNQSNDFPNEMMDDLEYGIDDIELPEDVQIHFSDSYKSEDAEREKKYFATVSDNNSMASDGEDAGRQYECRHCGKRYRWKSTLRRHENVECGGKEACHECPYCNYKAKQRGNLGVHIRKHHGDKPPLETRRNKKVVQTL